MDVEIIEFIRPEGGEHTLYITGVSAKVEYHELYEFLHVKFAPFGLIYEVQIIDSNPTNEADDTPTKEDEANHGNTRRSSLGGSLYAFVKFYSKEAASTAKIRLTGRLYLAGQHLRIQFSNKKKPIEAKSLYITKCYELANHYLGFNGWAIAILMIRQNEEHSKIKASEVQFVCGVTLKVKDHGLVCEGYGVSTMEYDLSDPTTKSIAHCRAKKLSYSEAVQNAFKRVLLVVLENGKVYAEANSTVEERVYCDEQLTTDNLLKVNDLDANPLEEDEEEGDGFDDSLDVDVLNKQLLEQLEDENT